MRNTTSEAALHSAMSPPIGARAVLLVLLTTVALRLPTLLEPHHYGDEGVFAAVAQRLLQGYPLYAAAWDDKPPLVYWLYAAVLWVWGPSIPALRALAALWAAAVAVAATLLADRMSGRPAGLAAGLLCAVLLSTPFIEANLALTELFGAAPVAWAFVSLTAEGASSQSWRRAVVAGALLAVGFLFKQVYALDALAMGIFLLLTGSAGRRHLLAMGVSYAGVLALVAGILLAQGALGEGLYAVFGFYTVYLREGSGMPPVFAVMRLAPATLAVALVLAARRRRALTRADLATLWLGFAASGAVLAARPFGHYLVQVVAPLSLGTALAGATAIGKRTAAGIVPVCFTSLLVLMSAFSGFWLTYPMVRPDYYTALMARLTGQGSHEAVEGVFSWRVTHQHHLAAIIRGDDERTLFVWGEYPWLYPLAGARNPTRYVTSYQTAFRPHAKAEVLEALRRTPPRYIVWERDEWRRLPGLAEIVAAHYERIAAVGNTELYRRTDPER